MSAGVAIASPERSLEDEIFHLQKLDLRPPVRKVVEEAAQLFGDGRHMEACALIEKAQAMRTVEKSPEAPNGHGTEPPVREAAEDPVADLVNNLAKGLAEVLVGAIRGIEKHLTTETRALGASFQQQLERLTEMAVDQKSATAAASESFRRAGERHDAELRDLRAQFQQFSSVTSERLDAVCSRAGVQQEELAALQTSVLGVSPRVTALVDRLDRQADAIRSMYDGQALRETVLDEVMGVLGRLKTGTPAVPADQL